MMASCCFSLGFVTPPCKWHDQTQGSPCCSVQTRSRTITEVRGMRNRFAMFSKACTSTSTAAPAFAESRPPGRLPSSSSSSVFPLLLLFILRKSAPVIFLSIPNVSAASSSSKSTPLGQFAFPPAGLAICSNTPLRTSFRSARIAAGASTTMLGPCCSSIFFCHSGFSFVRGISSSPVFAFSGTTITSSASSSVGSDSDFSSSLSRPSNMLS
mmetsp:Transcript_1283/g.2851  ORF Transcript_1283/g.2851 Transcript_1283/m.2851 type:complete len:212 (-) Transcript_1283:2017-2652(-)